MRTITGLGARPTPIQRFLPLVFVYKKRMQERETLQFDSFCWYKFQFIWTSKSVATHRYGTFQKGFLDQPLPSSSNHWSRLICRLLVDFPKLCQSLFQKTSTFHSFSWKPGGWKGNLWIQPMVTQWFQHGKFSPETTWKTFDRAWNLEWWHHFLVAYGLLMGCSVLATRFGVFLKVRFSWCLAIPFPLKVGRYLVLDGDEKGKFPNFIASFEGNPLFGCSVVC